MKKNRLCVCLFAFGVKRTSVLETRSDDQRWLKPGRTLDNRGQGVRI